jgi:hypothetical protein
MTNEQMTNEQMTNNVYFTISSKKSTLQEALEKNVTKIANILFKPHLDPGEEIMAVCHRHIFVVTVDFFRILLFGAFIPSFLWYLFPDFGPFFVIWYTISFVRFFYVFFNWYHDALLITNVSLIKVGWDGFFDRSSTRLEYQMIEGLSYAIKGFKRTVFNYGDVTISRAGTGSALTLHDAVSPPKVERLVLSAQERFVSHQNLKDADALKNLLTVMLRHHAKTQGIPEQEE